MAFNATKAPSSARGYGLAHQKARAAWKLIVDANDGIGCCLCGEWVDADEAWHLDHTEDRSGYRGVAHRACNLKDGARRGNAARNSADPKPWLVRDNHPCPVCSTPVVWASQRCCSRACSGVLRRANRKPTRKPTKTCGTCASTFTPMHSRQRYCTPLCSTIKCAHCDNRIQRKPDVRPEGEAICRPCRREHPQQHRRT